MSNEDDTSMEINSNCLSSTVSSTDGRDLLNLSNLGADEECSTAGFHPERKSIYSEGTLEIGTEECMVTDDTIPSEIADLTLEVESSSTGDIIGNDESEEISSQNPSSNIVHDKTTVFNSVVYKETKIVHLLSLDQNVESDSEYETVSSASQPSNKPPYVLSELFAGNCSDSVLRVVSACWTSTYNSNKLEALKTLIELILHSAGCKCALSTESVLRLMKSSIPVIDNWICQKLVCLTVDPNIWNDSYIEKIRKFWKLTIQSEVLMNISFVNQVLYLLEAMVKCKWSSARFTAAIFGGLIVQRYNKLYLTPEVQFSNFSPSSSSTNLAALRYREIIFNIVQKLLDTILKTLRDVEVVIRKFMFEIFVKWFENWPAVFLHDKYLRHIHFAFFDDCLQIRLQAIQASTWLVTDYKLSGKIDLFIEKTVPLFFKRVRDPRGTVVVEAIRAIGDIHRALPTGEIWKYGSPEDIYCLIFKREASVASEAALFLYNNSALSNYHSDAEKFNRELTNFLFEGGNMVKSDLLEQKLIASMFKHAQKQLTEWHAWRSLLLDDSMESQTHLQEIACRLLYAIVCYSAGNTNTKMCYPPLPANVIDKVETESGRVKKAKEQLKLNKLALTNELAPYLAQLWDKYKHNKNCLIPLIKIPQHFSSHVENIDMKKLCLSLIKIEQTLQIKGKDLDEDIISSLSVMHRLMSSSIRWNQEVVKFEKCLFDPVSKSFLASCQQLQHSAKQSKELNISKNLLRKAFFLSKYFDMTSTEMPDIALKVFEFGAARLNAQIISAVSMICLYLAQWELKNIAEKKYVGEESKAKLYTLSSHIKTMYNLLESLVAARDFRIADNAYSVMSALLAIFCPKNVYVKPYSVIHLPPPSLVLSEWLSFYLSPGGLWNRYSRDELWFSKSLRSVNQFCTLVITGVLHITYISTLLPYFSHYKLKKNYNTALKNLVKLFPLPGFPQHLSNAMASLLKSFSHNSLENIANGICFVVLNKVKPVYIRNNVATQVVWTGLQYITDHQDLSLFVVLAPFVKLMSKNQATKIKPILMETFHLRLDDPWVKKTVDAFTQRTKQPKGQGEPASSQSSTQE